MKQKITYLLLLLSLSLPSWADYASNVSVRQVNKDIVVSYDLSKKSNVNLLISVDGSSYTLLQAVEGDVGMNVHPGKALSITWHPLVEREKFIANNVRFKVEALGSYEQYILPRWRGNMQQGGNTDTETFVIVDVAYATAPQVSVGLSVGQTYGGYGWYVNARSNFHFKLATDGLKCGEGGYIDDILPFYSGRSQSSLFVANAGFVIDIVEIAGGSLRNRFNTLGLYVGGGYGSRRMLWETVDEQWIEYSPTSYSGFSMNVGVMGSIYGLTIKAGVNTVNFKYLELEAGIGWMF